MDNVFLPVSSVLNKNNIISTSNDKTQIVNGTNFSGFLNEALNTVIEDTNKAEQLSAEASIGNVNDLSEVAIAIEKANVGIQLTVEVRNKVISAYQEIMRMQI